MESLHQVRVWKAFLAARGTCDSSVVIQATGDASTQGITRSTDCMLVVQVFLLEILVGHTFCALIGPKEKGNLGYLDKASLNFSLNCFYCRDRVWTGGLSSSRPDECLQHATLSMSSHPRIAPFLPNLLDDY